jgi:hypothetical protein
MASQKDSGQAGMTDKNALYGFTNDRISKFQKDIANIFARAAPFIPYRGIKTAFKAILRAVAASMIF